MAVTDMSRDIIYTKGVLNILAAFLFSDGKVRANIIGRWLQYEPAPNQPLTTNITVLLHHLLSAPMKLEITATCMSLFDTGSKSLLIPLSWLTLTPLHTQVFEKIRHLLAPHFRRRVSVLLSRGESYSDFRFNDLLEIVIDREVVVTHVVRAILSSTGNQCTFLHIRGVVDAARRELLGKYYDQDLMTDDDAPCAAVDDQQRRDSAIRILSEISDATTTSCFPISRSDESESSISSISTFPGRLSKSLDCLRYDDNV